MRPDSLMRYLVAPILALTALAACSDAAPAPGSEAPPRVQVRGPDAPSGQAGSPVVGTTALPRSPAEARDARDPADVADDLEKGGDVMVRRGDLPGAIARYARSVEATRSLVAQRPDDAGLLPVLTRRLEKAAYACRLGGRAEHAIVLYREHVRCAGQLLGQAAADGGEAPVRPGDVLRSLQTIGDLQLGLGHAEEALVTFRAALERLERAPEEERATENHRRNLSVAHGRVAFAQQNLGSFDDGRASWARSIELAQSVAEAQPADVERRLELAGALTGAAALERAAGRLDAAADLLERSLTLHRQVAESVSAGAPPTWRHGLSVAAARLARLELERNRPAAAQPLARESLQALESVLPDMTNDLAALNEKASRHALLSDVARAAGDWDAAITQRTLGLRTIEGLVERTDGAPSAWQECARVHAALVDLQRQAAAADSGDRKREIEHHRTRARQAAAQAVARDPGLSSWERDLARALDGRAAATPDEEGRVLAPGGE